MGLNWLEQLHYILHKYTLKTGAIILVTPFKSLDDQLGKELPHLQYTAEIHIYFGIFLKRCFEYFNIANMIISEVNSLQTK